MTARPARVQGAGTDLGDPEVSMRLYVSGGSPAALPEHGGESAATEVPWWTTPYGRWRLAAEIEAMQRFPGFRQGQTEDGQLGWVGWIESSLEGGDRYLVRVLYPSCFPDEPPGVFIDEPHLEPPVPHLLNGNRPCLYHPAEGPRNGYDPARTTAATLVAWTALWANAYETWRATGNWPGRAH
jgi:hypothetical protein